MKDFKVKCIANKTGARFTVGKTYETENGYLPDDYGYPYGVGGFENLEDIQQYGPFKSHGCEFVKESKMFTKENIQSGDKIWTNFGHGIAVSLQGKMILPYIDHSGFDYLSDGSIPTIVKVIRPTKPGQLSKEFFDCGNVIFDREKGIGCEPPVKEISVEEATKLLTEKFGQNVRIRVSE